MTGPISKQPQDPISPFLKEAVLWMSTAVHTRFNKKIIPQRALESGWTAAFLKTPPRQNIEGKVCDCL